MTFILGQSKLGYDFLGDWQTSLDASCETADAFIGDASNPASCQPGTFAPCGEVGPPVFLRILTTPSQA